MADIVGYERTEQHYLYGAWQRRYCLACYQSDSGLPVKPITREALLGQLRPAREEGVSNVGGQDLCSKCGKRLLFRGEPTLEEAQETRQRLDEIERAIVQLLDLPYITDKECERLDRALENVYSIHRRLVRASDAKPKPIQK